MYEDRDWGNGDREMGGVGIKRHECREVAKVRRGRRTNARLIEDRLPGKNDTLFRRGETVCALGRNRGRGGRCWPWRPLRGCWGRH